MNEGPAEMTIQELGLFPLSAVLLPTMLVPLNVFEPRYLSLLSDIGGADGRFGVVLLRRGSEVGPSDPDYGQARSSVGPTARILDMRPAKNHANEPCQILIVGEERFRVSDWLADNPYPRAAVQAWPEESATANNLAVLSDQVSAVRSELDRLNDVIQRMGQSLGPLPETDHDVTIASYQLCAAAPLQAHDKQRLLESPGVDDRLCLLRSLVSDLRRLFEMQLDLG